MKGEIKWKAIINNVPGQSVEVVCELAVVSSAGRCNYLVKVAIGDHNKAGSPSKVYMRSLVHNINSAHVPLALDG